MNAIEGLTNEWPIVGRGPGPADALEALRLNGVAVPAGCDDLYDLVEAMRRDSGRTTTLESAALVAGMLRESNSPLVARALVQALIPGMLGVAGKLRWGQSGEWSTRDDFVVDLVSTTWEVITEWAGDDRPYAVRDLLSAVRCRLRRRMVGAWEDGRRLTDRAHELDQVGTLCSEPDIDHLARVMVRPSRLDTVDLEVVYAVRVLGYSIKDVAHMMGMDRRGLTRRLDRASERLAAAS